MKMTMTEQGMAALPHVVTFNKGISMLFTLPGRAPLCLKCRCTGHIRREYPQGGPPKTPMNSARTEGGLTQHISYSQVVAGTAPAADIAEISDTAELEEVQVESSEVGSPMATPLSADEGDEGDEGDENVPVEPVEPMEEGAKQGQKRRAQDEDVVPDTVNKLAEEIGK